MCTSTKKGVWAGEEDEIRGSHLDWRLEIVEGQRGLWSVTQATALAKKKNHRPAEPDRGVRLRCLALFCFAPLLLYFFRRISSWGLTNGASNTCHRTMVEASRRGENNGMFFFASRISWESVPRCVWSRLRLNLHAQLPRWSCGVAGTLGEDVNPGRADSNDLH